MKIVKKEASKGTGSFILKQIPEDFIVKLAFLFPKKKTYRTKRKRRYIHDP